MILSASRRTDLPSLYPEWLYNRLREGCVIVPNPYRTGHAVKLMFSPETVDCIVFWTKNPIPLEPYLSRIERLGYPNYYFSYTITAFGGEEEPNLPPLEERLESFRRLSRRLGAERVDWRFDPVLINEKYSVEWTAERFSVLCRELNGFTKRCILSFAGPYRHLKNSVPPMKEEEIQKAAKALAAEASRWNLPLVTCAEEMDLTGYGIHPGACISREKLEAVTGNQLKVKKDAGQRPACGCVESYEIGAYNTCVNGCFYCYATRNSDAARRVYAAHSPTSPVLGDIPGQKWILNEKNPPSLQTGQIAF